MTPATPTPTPPPPSTPRLLLLPLLLAGCATTTSTTGLRSPQVLLDTDRAFAAEAQAHGIQAAFTRFAAPDALVLEAGGVLRGRDAVQTTFAGTDQVDLTWEPGGGELSPDGEVGFTWGTWRRRLKNAPSDAAPPRTGRYLTTWRRTAEGYRWTADLGDSDPPAAPP
jgi:ketosteroid isomerase-like protein